MPEFHLAEGVVTLRCYLIVWTYHERRPAFDVQKLDHQRELASETGVGVFSDNVFEVCFQDFADGAAFQPAAHDFGVTESEVGKFPALPYLVRLGQRHLDIFLLPGSGQSGLDLFSICFSHLADEPVSAPFGAFCHRTELHRI